MDGVSAIAEWVAWLEARGAPETTIRSYSSSVSRFLVRYVKGPPRKADAGDVVRFLSDVGKNGPHGRRQALKGLRSAFSYWCPRGIATNDPTTIMPKERRPKERRQVALEEDELVRYLYAAACRGQRRAGALMVAFGLGLRRCELIGITSDDDLGDRVRVTGKYGKTRDVPVNAIGRAGLDLLKPWNNGTLLGGLKAATISEWAKQAAKDSGLYPKVRHRPAHVLRASFISHALRNGANPVAVRDVVGHESLATTNEYAAAFNGDQEDVVKRVTLG
jgi:site-specific recombinase XerD